MDDAKRDAEALLNAAMPFAETLLKKRGEFYPFAFRMTAEGAIEAVAAYDGREMPPSQALFDLLIEAFRAEAAAGRIRATAIARDVRISRDGEAEKTDAIAVDLDHQDNYSVSVFVPYTLTKSPFGRTVVFGETRAQQGKNEIFVLPAGR